MICVDDVTLNRQRRRVVSSSYEQVWRRKVMPFICRWRPRLERFGLAIVLVVSVVVLLLVWVAKLALAEFTAPDTFVFASIGDFGAGNKMQHTVAHQMAVFGRENEIKFVAGVGDNFYEAGIRDLDDEQLLTKFEEVYKDSYLTTIPWYMALGDHDHCGNVSAQVEYSQRSPIWRMPSPYFVEHIHHGQGLTLDLIVTDSVSIEGAILDSGESRRFEYQYNQTFAGKVAGIKQLIWLKNTLKDSTADWIVVMGHRPLYSVASRSRYPVEYRMRTELMPMFEKYGVDLYLHGHDHVGQHSTRGHGIVHIGNGVGGYVNQPINHVDKETIWSNARYHGFCMHQVTQEYMVISFVNSYGVPLHHGVINSKRKQRTTEKQSFFQNCVNCFKKPQVDP